MLTSINRARLFTAATLLAILWLTLTPELRAGAHPAPSPWCFHCGDGDSVDILLNILLFVPLGTGLAWLGLGRGLSLLLASSLTIGIELTQFYLIPGRDGSIRDVLCNAGGAAIGFGLASLWVTLLFPPSRLAARAFGTALGAWLALWALVIWALGGTAPGGEWWIQLDPHGMGSVDFPGRLISASLNSQPYPNGLITEPRELKAAVDSHAVAGEVVLVSGGPVTGTAPVFGLVTDAPVEVLRLSQRDDDLLYRFDVRGYGAGLAVPVFALGHALAHAGDTIRIGVQYSGRHLQLAAFGPGIRTDVNRVWITPSLGWMLFWPFEPRRPDQAAVITLLWAASLPFIVGYYGRRWIRSGAGVRMVGWQIVLVGLLTTVTLPVLAGLSAVTVPEFLATVAGTAAGALLAGPLARVFDPAPTIPSSS